MKNKNSEVYIGEVRGDQAVQFVNLPLNKPKNGCQKTNNQAIRLQRAITRSDGKPKHD